MELLQPRWTPIERDYFHIQNKEIYKDPDEFEFVEQKYAISDAIRYTGELLQYDPSLLTVDGRFSVRLTDKNNRES